MPQSGFSEVRKYQETEPAPRWYYGPREATGTLVNSICMSLGGGVAFALEEMAAKSEDPTFSMVAEHPIINSIGFGILFRTLAYVLRNGGSTALGDTITYLWDKIFKGKKND